MPNRYQQPRTDKFKWDSRQRLYEYFQDRASLVRQTVDREIEKGLAEFKLRQGQPIDPRELWQKVGMRLSRKFSDLNDDLYRDPFIESGGETPMSAPEDAPGRAVDTDTKELPAFPGAGAMPTSAAARGGAQSGESPSEIPHTPEPALVFSSIAPKGRTPAADSDEAAQPGIFARVGSLFKRKSPETDSAGDAERTTPPEENLSPSLAEEEKREVAAIEDLDSETTERARARKDDDGGTFEVKT